MKHMILAAILAFFIIMPITNAQTWADALFNQMILPDFFGAVMASYTNVFGSTIYFLIFGLALTMIYMKTKNFGNVVVIAMLTSSVAVFLVPSVAWPAIATIIAFGIAGILYKVFH